jgi:anti-sigma factor RsiW
MLERLLREPKSESGSADSSADLGGMGGLGRSSAELVERFVDGTLSDRERLVFEKSLETDAVLCEHVAMQRRVDAALRGKLAPSELVLKHIAASVVAAEDPLSPAAASGQPEGSAILPAKKRVNWLRVAALVAVAVSGYFAYTTFLVPGGNSPTIQLVAPAIAFQREVSEGMQPYAVCTTSEEFATYTKTQLGVALKVRPVDGLALIGWDYESVFSRRTVMLLAKYRDKPIVVFMDKVAHGHDNTCMAANESERVIGDVFLHEVRAADSPSMLDAFEEVK